ncbi:serine/threonine-protein kinase [Pseudonocardia nematodicida]|uniref:non-specific serine/threonine protein kinase n=1 Tax=Pseudonocardia nematodicida TaxID=1206997 RepID=A0ABV1K9W7_9PSEU
METFGRYRIEALLGRGGMGEVHRAHDPRNDRTVALKRLRADLPDSGGFRDRFRRESRIAARLSSPHVIPIHDAGEIDGRLYIDMRLVDGRDLAEILRSDGPLEPSRVAAVVAQIADALHAAHTEGLIHRDVKPSNVLVLEREGAPDFVYLVDFGIARAAEAAAHSRLTSTGVVVGTLAYMSPETFTGGEVDRRTDVYALACLAHELLTGRLPFDAEGPALMFAHLSTPPPRASGIRPELPTAVDDVLVRGMAKEPGDRFDTAPALAGALAEALTSAATGPRGRSADAPTITERAGPGPVPVPRRPRRRWVAALAVPVLLLAGVAAAFTWVPGLVTGAGGGSLVLPVETDDGTGDTYELAARDTLRGIFPLAGDVGCRPSGSPSGRTAPVAGLACPWNGDTLFYEAWPTVDDAQALLAGVAARPGAVEGRWTVRGSAREQGGYALAPDRGRYVLAAVYDDRRFSTVVVADTEEAARRTLSFSASRGVTSASVPD